MQKTIRKILRILEYINLRAIWVSMAALFVLMIMTSYNAIVRRAGIGGVADSLDLTQLLMILIIFCALAFQESKRGHIRVDMFVVMMPKLASKLVDGFFNLISAGILGIFAYAYYDSIAGSRRSGAATQVYRIPEWPFVIVVSIVIALFALTMLFNTIDIFLYGDSLTEGESDAEPDTEET